MSTSNWHGPAKAKKPPQGLEGVTYTHHGMPYTGQGTGAKRRRKVTLADLERTQAACDRAQRASDAIRARRGLWHPRQRHHANTAPSYRGGYAIVGDPLPPVPPNHYREALALALAEAKAAPQPKQRKAKAAVNGNGASPAVDVPRPASLATVAAAVRARSDAELELVREVARAHENGASMAALAGEVGMTRQGLYKLMARTDAMTVCA